MIQSMPWVARTVFSDAYSIMHSGAGRAEQLPVTDMATDMAMAMEDIMQSNTVNSRDGEIEIDLLQLSLDILDGVRRQG